MTSKSDSSTAAGILRAAMGHMEQRAATYDKPEGERSMGATVDAFKAVTGVSMTEGQGWLFMALLKAVRSQQGGYRADSYEDGAAYFALAGESAARDRLPRNESLDRLREKIKAGEGISFGGGVAMPATFGQQHTINPLSVVFFEEPASQIDDDSPRMQAIAQNGNDGAVYVELDRMRADHSFNDDVPASMREAVEQREPCQPRHRCLACAGGHSTHQCGSDS